MNCVDRNGVEVVELRAPAPLGGDEVGVFQQAEVFGDGLPLDIDLLAELIERLAIVAVQAVEELSWVGSASALKTLSIWHWC